MKRKILCLLLILSFLLYPCYNMGAASIKKISLTIDIGKVKIINLSKYGIKKSDKIVSMENPSDWMTNRSAYIDSWDYTRRGNNLLFRPKSSGRFDFIFVFQSEKRINLFGVSDGALVSRKKYNELTDIIGLYKAKTYEYMNVFLDFIYDSKGNISSYSVESYKVTNLTDSVVKPDIKITFYDKNKKKLFTSRATTNGYGNINAEIQPNSTYSWFLSSIFEWNKVKKAKYWRIESI